MDFMAQSAAPQLAQLQNQLQGLFAQCEQLNKLKPAAATPSLTPGRTSSLPFVSGADGARAYLKSMAANSSDAVFDKEDSVFYLLSVDANGVPAPIKLGRFTLEDLPEPESNVITKKDLEDFRAEIRSMLEQTARPPKSGKADKEAAV